MNCSSVHEGSQEQQASSFDSEALLAELTEKSTVILNAKCVSCHNASSTDSELKNVLDIDVLTQGGFIVVGSPQSSPLYLSVVDDIMPSDNIEKLTAGEKETLRDWISALGGNFDTIIGGGDIDTGGADQGPPGTYTQVRAILNARCVNCHGGGGSPPNLTGSYAQLMAGMTRNGLPVVVARDPGRSRLYASVAGDSMPQNQNPLTAEQKRQIRTWISAGAPNN